MLQKLVKGFNNSSGKRFFLLLSSMLFVIAGCLRTHLNQENSTQPCAQIKYHHISQKFKEFTSEKTTILLEKLELCTNSAQENAPTEQEACHYSKFKLIELSEMHGDYLLVETNSTHHAGSGGNRLYFYKKDEEKYKLLASFQGFTKGISPRQDYPDDVIASFFDDKVGEILILLSLSEERYLPQHLLSINEKAIPKAHCDSLYSKYIEHFLW